MASKQSQIDKDIDAALSNIVMGIGHGFKMIFYGIKKLNSIKNVVFLLVMLDRNDQSEETQSKPSRVIGLNSPWGNRGEIIKSFGWTYDYLLWGISWLNVHVIRRSNVPYNINISDLAMSSVNFFISGIVVSQTGFEFFIPAINV